MRQKAMEMWFGCPKCLFKPEQDQEKSNQNWNVFTTGNCPKCGIEMRINFNNKKSKTKQAGRHKQTEIQEVER